MGIQINKIIIQFVFFELLFVFLLNLGLTFLPHQEFDLIYYLHINIYYLIACFSFLNYLISKLNRFLILLFFSIASILAVLALFTLFIFYDYQTATNYNYYYYYNLQYILVNTVLLFITFYLFIYIKKPYQKLLFHVSVATIVTIILSIIIYSSLFVSGEIFQFSADNLFSMNNRVYLINFTILLLFWNEYSKQKHDLSEYISIIIVIYTIIIGVEIVHIFLIKNDLVFLHNLGQYFTAILHLLMLTTWVIRLHYLHSPLSKENEHYIKNYKVLQGLIEKPRKGLFEKIYHKINTKMIWTFILILSLNVGMILVLNHFNLFIRENIILLVFSLIISIFFARLYWDKRWYRAIDFLIKKKKK